jgi:hypothetical protein
MKNLHILPTDKPSRVYKELGRELKYTTKYFEQKGLLCINQNIYITTDVEIKEGDWYYYFGHIVKYDSDENTLTPNCKNIILTTDQDLIKGGIQSIDDEFLEWFVKNPSCEEVDINRDWGYPKIIIPKEELIDCEYCGGDGIYVDGDNNTSKCTMCEKGKILKEEPTEEAKQRAKNYMSLKGALEPKQETLEEAAERYCEKVWGGYKDDVFKHDDIITDSTLSEISKTDFIEGAKWQQERMYSEEDVKHIVTEALQSALVMVDFEQWFKQFKKK